MRNDSFDPVRPVPRFLAEQEEQGFGDVRDEGVVLRRLFKVSLLVAAVAVTGIAVLAMGNPLTLFTDATASLAGNSSPQPQPATDQAAPAVQSAANAPALSETAADAQPLPQAAPAREEVVAAVASASNDQNRDQAETTKPSSEALFRQFQSWLSEQDAQAKAEPVQPAQDPPAQVVADPAQVAAPAPIMRDAPVQATEDDARIAHPPLPKRRHVPPVHEALVDPRAPNARKPATRPQDARAARPPVQHVQDARAQEPPPPQPQPTQAPSFLPIFGQRN
jgi:hypothetical protein